MSDGTDNSFKNCDDYSPNKEEVLIQKIQKGSSRAFKVLMETYFKELASFAYQYVKSSHIAKDVVQDVFANIWERKEAWEPTKSVKKYLYQSVENEALKKVRDKKTENKYLEAYANEEDRKMTPKEFDKESQFKQAVQKAIKELPDRARMAYTLHRRDGLTYKEIAEIMEISHRTVESQISRALKILQNKLSSYLPVLLMASLLIS